jgi:hypothetical protein
MSASTISARRSWVPGRLYALRQLRNVEVLGATRHCHVQVGATTLFGTAEELEALAHQLMTVVRREAAVAS